jgi:hypothetical protein
MNYDEWDDIIGEIWNLRPGWIDNRDDKLLKAKAILASLVEEVRKEEK